MADFFCSAVLCCTLLCCTLLYCAVLYCTVLYSAVLFCVYFPGGKPPFPGRKSRFPGRKKRRAARKDLSGQIAVFPVSDRTNSHLTGRRILFPLRQTHRSVCHAERKSPLTHSADTGKIDLKRSSGMENFHFSALFRTPDFLFSVDNTKFRCHNRYVISKML